MNTNKIWKHESFQKRAQKYVKSYPVLYNFIKHHKNIHSADLIKFFENYGIKIFTAPIISNCVKNINKIHFEGYSYTIITTTSISKEEYIQSESNKTYIKRFEAELNSIISALEILERKLRRIKLC